MNLSRSNTWDSVGGIMRIRVVVGETRQRTYFHLQQGVCYKQLVCPIGETYKMPYTRLA